MNHKEVDNLHSSSLEYNQDKTELTRKQKLGRIMAVAALTLAGIGAVKGIEVANTPIFSNATEEVTADNFWGAAQQVESAPDMNMQDIVAKVKEMNPDLDPNNIKKNTKFEVPSGASKNIFDQTAQKVDAEAAAASNSNEQNTDSTTS